MNILIPVAAYHEYNTARYVTTAFQQLDYQARVITQAEFYQDHPDADLFFCVDSAGPLDFPEKHLTKTCMWFIDSRHNCDPNRRVPDDDTNAAKVAAGGGWVFQAQKLDWVRNLHAGGITRACWLPLAADSDVWQPILPTEKVWDVGFGGNVWDDTRREALDAIGGRFSLETFTGAPEELVVGYAASRMGFNISSFYGTSVDYDVNMRVFEVMSCGIPLITNHLVDLTELGIVPGHHALTYRSVDEVLELIESLLNAGAVARNRMGRAGRNLVLAQHTYRHRMVEALGVLVEAGVVNR